VLADDLLVPADVSSVEVEIDPLQGSLLVDETPQDDLSAQSDTWPDPEPEYSVVSDCDDIAADPPLDTGVVQDSSSTRPPIYTTKSGRPVYATEFLTPSNQNVCDTHDQYHTTSSATASSLTGSSPTPGDTCMLALVDSPQEVNVHAEVQRLDEVPLSKAYHLGVPSKWWSKSMAIYMAKVDAAEHSSLLEVAEEEEEKKDLTAMYIATPNHVLTDNKEEEQARLERQKVVEFIPYEGRVYDPTPHSNPVAVPRTMGELKKLSARDFDLWKKSIQSELTGLFKSGTLIPCSRTECLTRPIGTKIVFAAQDKDGEGIGETKRKIKSRLVALGFQEPNPLGIHWSAPTIGQVVLKLMVIIGLTLGWIMEDYDIEQAFLNAPVKKEEQIYVEMPKIIDSGSRYYRVTRGLYGLASSPSRFYNHLADKLIGYGLKRSKWNSCLFFGKGLMLCIWVDDLKIMGTRKGIDKLIQHLARESMTLTKGKNGRYLGLQWKYDQERKTCTVDQTHYIEDILKAFRMTQDEEDNGHRDQEPKPVGTPGEKDSYLQKIEEKTCNELYPKLVGKLIFLLNSRLDIAFAVKELSRHMAKNDEIHWQAAKRVLRYLSGTKEIPLTLKGVDSYPVLQGFCDASYRGAEGKGKGTTGYIIAIGSSPICARSVSQHCTTGSSTEAEVYAAVDLAVDLIYYRKILEELGFPQKGPTVIWTDNQPSLSSYKDGFQGAILKTVDHRISRIREWVMDNLLEFKYLETKEMPADLLTKHMAKNTFEYLRDMMMNAKLKVP
jgi:hypothetical protein